MRGNASGCSVSTPNTGTWTQRQTDSQLASPIFRYPQRLSVSGKRLILYPEDTKTRRTIAPAPERRDVQFPVRHRDPHQHTFLVSCQPAHYHKKLHIAKVPMVGSRFGMAFNICFKAWEDPRKTVVLKCLKHSLLPYTFYVRETRILKVLTVRLYSFHHLPTAKTLGGLGACQHPRTCRQCSLREDPIVAARYDHAPTLFAQSYTAWWKQLLLLKLSHGLETCTNVSTTWRKITSGIRNPPQIGNLSAWMFSFYISTVKSGGFGRWRRCENQYIVPPPTSEFVTIIFLKLV